MAKQKTKAEGKPDDVTPVGDVTAVEDVAEETGGGDAPPAGGDKIAALERKVAELTARLEATPLAAPPGYRLVPEGESVEEKAERLLKEKTAEFDRGVQARSQDVADKAWPEGKHVYRCSLSDRNGHPELLIRANNPTDAKGRYFDVIGVTGSETKATIVRA
jgi:hypothetical protein